jgi:hypothetical protein
VSRPISKLVAASTASAPAKADSRNHRCPARLVAISRVTIEVLAGSYWGLVRFRLRTALVEPERRAR